MFATLHYDAVRLMRHAEMHLDAHGEDYYIILHYSVLYYIILYYIILHYTLRYDCLLYYIVLYDVLLAHGEDRADSGALRVQFGE